MDNTLDIQGTLVAAFRSVIRRITFGDSEQSRAGMTVDWVKSSNVLPFNSRCCATNYSRAKRVTVILTRLKKVLWTKRVSALFFSCMSLLLSHNLNIQSVRKQKSENILSVLCRAERTIKLEIKLNNPLLLPYITCEDTHAWRIFSVRFCLFKSVLVHALLIYTPSVIKDWIAKIIIMQVMADSVVIVTASLGKFFIHKTLFVCIKLYFKIIRRILILEQRIFWDRDPKPCTSAYERNLQQPFFFLDEL